MGEIRERCEKDWGGLRLLFFFFFYYIYNITNKIKSDVYKSGC